jgi:hypothetical protein
MDNEFVMDLPDCVFKVPDPPLNITVYGPDGREATIDFGGDAVVYSGDLPVDESAKIFFDAVFSHFKR